jgi:hypothetical protein
MSRLSLVVSLFSLGLWGCEEKETIALPQSGDWTISSTEYTDDDCNAEGFLLPFDEVTISDVETSSFAITYFLDNVRIGESSSTCTHVEDDSFDCSAVDHSTPFSETATINMTAVGTVAIISESSITGAGDLVLDCAGFDCNQLEGMTNSGSLPCGTTLNWTAKSN